MNELLRPWKLTTLGAGLLVAGVRATACVGLAAISALSASAQDVMPSDLDLRSAYCLPIVKNAATKAQGLARLTTTTDAESRLLVALKQHAEEKSDELRRLQAYLLPRLTVLDPTALTLAMNRGETDVGRADEINHTCGTQCGGSEATDPAVVDRHMACRTACMNANPVVKRVKSCFPVNWLPF
jgi:hypothetical protein